MPSTTPGRNLPYPLGTDRLMDGDDQIRKLAQSVENMTQAGIAQVNVTTGGTLASLSVTFPVAFAAAPVVVVTPVGTNPPTITAAANTITATAFICVGVRGTSGLQPVNWFAVGPINAVA